MGRRALVIEGGGMKAAYVNGILSAFEEADYHPWDLVVGTSAGGTLAAWYSAGQARYAEETWKYISDPRFLSVRRALLRQGPFLDHEALMDIVYQDEHPLDLEALSKAPWEVLVTVVDVETAECKYVDIRNDRPIDWLKATGRLPFASNGPVEIGGREYLDGGVVDPVPIKHTVESLGATEVTLLLNNPPGPKKSDPRLVLELSSRRYPALRQGIFEHQDTKQRSYAYALDPPEGVHIEVIRPAGPLGLGRFSKDMDKVIEALERGRRDGQAYLSASLQTTR